MYESKKMSGVTQSFEILQEYIFTTLETQHTKVPNALTIINGTSRDPRTKI